MKVVHIQKVAGIAGSEAHLMMLLPKLRAHGWQPHMIVLKARGNQPEAFIEHLQANGVSTEVLPVRGHVDPTLPYRLSQRFRDLRPALVHTHLFHADLYGALALRGSRVPLISTKHGFDPWRVRPWWGWLNRLATRRAQHLIVISAAIGQWHCDVESLPPEKMSVVHYGLDAAIFRDAAAASTRTDDGRIRIGVVSRLIQQKGVDVLLRAFALLKADHQQADLLVVGDGPARASLEDLAQSLELSDRVKFLGYRRDVSTIMRELDVVAFPTHGEGFGLVVLEAWAWAKPVVASAVTSLPEIIEDERSGLLVPVGNEHALAAALSRLIQDAGLRRALGENGRQRLEHDFTIETMTRKTVDVYQGVLPRSAAAA